MPLNNCTIELKLKWTNYCVLSAAGNDNTNANPNNIIFTIKDTKLYVPVVTSAARDNQKLSTCLSKWFERSVYWDEYKTESDNENTTNQYKYFLKLNFLGVNRLFVLVCSNQDHTSKGFKTQTYYLPKGIIHNYTVIINGKTFIISQLILIYNDMKKL